MGIQDDDDDLFDFITKRFSQNSTRRLYRECRWSALGVLQHMSSLSKQLIVRLVNIRDEIPMQFLERNLNADKHNLLALRQSIKEMLALRVLTSNGNSYKFVPEFINQIYAVLVSVETDVSPFQDQKIIGYMDLNLNAEALDLNARRRWSQILHYIVGSDEFTAPTQSVKKLLVSMGLLRPMANEYMRSEITSQGYHFMLKDVHDQLWLFIKHYMRQLESPESVLQMLFKLSFCSVGESCSTKTLDSIQKSLLTDMSSFGLVYIDDQHKDVFFPTSLGVNLVFGKSRKEKATDAAKVLETDVRLYDAKDQNDKKKKRVDTVHPISQKEYEDSVFIITETNFKLYAYTSSTLYTQMIKLFSEPECMLPNLFVSVITRKSIRKAFQHDISAEQIIHFLQENVHPLCAKKNRPIPDNVSDQILLWESERNRIVPTSGVLYEGFGDNEKELFHACVRHGKRNDWLMFVGKNPPLLVVREQCKEEMKDFIRAERSK